MLENGKAQIIAMLMAVGLLGWACGPAAAAVRIEGQVQAGGGAVAGSTVSLWAASAGAPARLAQVQTDADGRFVVSVDQTPSGAPSFYLVASGGTPAANKAAGNNPAIGLLAVLGGDPPAKVVVNEMTTVASVWTNAQFLDGAAIKGHALGLKIAAGNVPNFVDLATGGWGGAIQDPLNSSQTPTMAQFRHIGRPAGRLRHTGVGRRVQQALRGGDAADGWRTDRHADGGSVHRPLSVVPARETLRAARRVLSGP